ncbi:D(2) dopamine receptor-like protein [Labeo rohita]|uniref:D(2) dopamine receptor-like protein n=1 Tax=Labeo rohita TaxID=84645 RepID=A0A498NY48_LABRO|nr:D(2) dopamine receptor-like protein [Labeo rohita]RXN36845.1 D(2) dopamine receptor-like protein [Labeo rohita]
MCQYLQKSLGSRVDPFGVYVLLPVWSLSLILIIIHYLRIFSIVRQHTNKITDTGVQFRPYFGRHLPRWDHVVPSASAQLKKSDSASDLFAPTGSHQAAPRIAGAVCILTPAARELGKKRLEGRVAKRFGYIIITATVFWAPLFIILLLNMCKDFGQNQRWLLRELHTCALVVTCVPAAVEPLIYTLLHRQLRSQLHKLLPSTLVKKS